MAMGNAPHGSSSSVILVGFPRANVVMVYSLKDNKARKKIDFGGVLFPASGYSARASCHMRSSFFDSPDTVPLNFSDPLFNESRGRSA
jgi:hypothetical protein